MRKAVSWQKVQRKRNGFERGYTRKFRELLNRQFKAVADRIDVTNMESEAVLNVIDKEDTEKAFIDLYKAVGVSFASDTYKGFKGMRQDILTKEDEDRWYNEMISYVKIKAGKRIVSITGETKRQALKIIRAILNVSTEEGWGADKTASNIRKELISQGTEINQWRALRIARTEIVTASNEGAVMGAKDTGLPMEKEWIATYDSRTRDTHMSVEGQGTKDMDETFQVGAYQMKYPGDPAGGAEEIINCRCTIGFNVKRT